MTNEEKIRLQKWWVDEIHTITRKVIEKEEKRKAKEKAKAALILNEFRSRMDILDAYGYGLISEGAKNKLLDMWDEVENGSDELYKAKIALLQGMYNEARGILQDLGEGSK